MVYHRTAMSKSELAAFLSETRLAHLATSSNDGKSRVSPIWYVYEDDCLYFTTRLARLKGRHIKENPLVSVSIASDDRPYRAVTAFGEAIVLRKNRDEWLEKISFRYLREEGRLWLADAIKERDRVVLRLTPQRLFSWQLDEATTATRERSEHDNTD